MAEQKADLTQLLHQVSGGNRQALDQIFPLVYDELRRIAHQQLRKWQMGETLNTTALVHEAYIKLIDQSQAQINDRAHFYALSALAMRYILVDHARSRLAAKRGGNAIPVDLEDIDLAADDRSEQVLALDEALERLMKQNPRLGKLVEYKFFGGLNYEEIAEVQGLSVPTIKRDWQLARAWLYQAMQENA
jgi:RNA polymerase sigma factor (TIGR02999 family)